MKQVLIQAGRAVVREMPPPACGDGEVLVRASYSLISTGTETVTLAQSGEAPAGVWTRRLRKLGEVVRMVTDRGLKNTVSAVRDRMEGPAAVTGYSLAGTVVRVGSAVDDLVPGQRVACAGAAAAHHAEFVAVPRNLVVPVPEDLDLDRAAFVTLGAIALQGVRQADPRLGEIVCVLGLGLVGQLTVGLLRASGCRVIGSDLVPERVETAGKLGLETGVAGGGDDLERAVDHATAGRGVDSVLLTASSPGSELIRQAVRLVRRRGRVVVVGSVGLELDRGELYHKEAELRISTSYGPGRYDPSYEQDGQDYPYAYVRWTENRNMETFIRLVASGTIDLSALRGESFPVDRAGEAYAALTAGPVEARPLFAMLRYPDSAAPGEIPARRAEVAAPPRRKKGLDVALVGPGSFAGEVHLPNLASLGAAAHLRAVVGRSANPAREIARRWAAEYAATDLEEILRDDDVDLVLICTRHDLHAEQAARALEAGKSVFLEKPAAINESGLQRLAGALGATAAPFVVGFNRRFAPDVASLVGHMRTRKGPLTVQYRVNAGKLPSGHWALGRQGGGRLLGEACHMVDLIGHLVGQPVTAHAIHALAPPAGRGDLPLGDNFQLSCRYADGSIANLLYTSLGSAAAGKERIEVHWDGHTAVIEDFKGLRVNGADHVTRQQPDKGHREILGRFVEHASGRGPAPIPAEEILALTRFMLDLDREMRAMPRSDGPEG